MSSTESVQLPQALHSELIVLASAVALKRAELECAQLRQELGVRRALEALGLGSHRVTIDLDARVVRLHSESESKD